MISYSSRSYRGNKLPRELVQSGAWFSPKVQKPFSCIKLRGNYKSPGSRRNVYAVFLLVASDDGFIARGITQDLTPRCFGLRMHALPSTPFSAYFSPFFLLCTERFICRSLIRDQQATTGKLARFIKRMLSLDYYLSFSSHWFQLYLSFYPVGAIVQYARLLRKEIAFGWSKRTIKNCRCFGKSSMVYDIRFPR